MNCSPLLGCGNPIAPPAGRPESMLYSMERDLVPDLPSMAAQRRPGGRAAVCWTERLAATRLPRRYLGGILRVNI